MGLWFNVLMLIFFFIAIGWTIYLRFPQFRVFRQLAKIKKKKSAYQTFLVSLATHIGTGNLIGVVTGIILAGPGVVFWMWIFAFFSSSFALAENTYAQVYKEIIDGEYRGGAGYYIRQGLGKPVLSFAFVITLLVTNTILFPPLQVNTIVIATQELSGLSPSLIGIVLLIVLCLIVFRGTKQIVKATDYIVPVMAIGYVAVMLFLIFKASETLGPVFMSIMRGAFALESFTVGAFFSVAGIGIRRSLFSNEAGLGTTPSISAMAEVETPTQQGYFQVLGVYVDTLLLCTLTAVFILQREENFSNFLGGELLFALFAQELGFFGSLLAFGFLFIFAFSSLIGQYYLGESNALFLSKDTPLKPKTIIFLYRIVFTAGIVLGIRYSTAAAMALVDLGLALLGCTNLWVLLNLEKTQKYLLRTLKNGII